MKKLLVLGLSTCLMLSFTGSAFAASRTNTIAKKKVIHTAVTKKKAMSTLTNAKKHSVSHKNINRFFWG